MPSDPKPLSRQARWDAEHMTTVAIRVRKEIFTAFRAACTARGEKVNTVLKQAMEAYIAAADHQP